MRLVCGPRWGRGCSQECLWTMWVLSCRCLKQFCSLRFWNCWGGAGTPRGNIIQSDIKTHVFGQWTLSAAASSPCLHDADSQERCDSRLINHMIMAPRDLSPNRVPHFNLNSSDCWWKMSVEVTPGPTGRRPSLFFLPLI